MSRSGISRHRQADTLVISRYNSFDEEQDYTYIVLSLDFLSPASYVILLRLFYIYYRHDRLFMLGPVTFDISIYDELVTYYFHL